MHNNMAILDPVKATVLATRVIARVDHNYARRLNLNDHQRSLALLTCDSDDVLYTALDAATKFAAVDVVYAHSFYAGAMHASGPLSGEIIGMLAGSSPAEVRAGLDAAVAYAEHDAFFQTANNAGDLIFFAHLVSRTGSYLSRVASVKIGEPLAYLIAPPLEALYGLDCALKAADVEMCEFFAPPSETNFAGGLLTGTQSACRAACAAFRHAVLEVAARPLDAGVST